MLPLLAIAAFTAACFSSAVSSFSSVAFSSSGLATAAALAFAFSFFFLFFAFPSPAAAAYIVSSFLSALVETFISFMIFSRSASS